MVIICGMKSIEFFLKKIKNKKLLVVFPHPDDESVMVGGLIQRAMALGFAVTVLTLTEGNRGKIYINGKGRSVTEIRRQEMALAMSILRVTDWIMWKFEDGKLRKGVVWRSRLRSFINMTKPGLVVSYDLSGVTAHPDHVSLSLEILRIYRENKNFGLLWTSFVGKRKELMVNNRAQNYLQKPKYILELNLRESFAKWRAAYSHKSQNLFGYLKSFWWVLAFGARTEWYSVAELDKKYKFKYLKFKI